MSLTIAMDGPVGAGKSSIADAVCARLGILHLDTGAMYRAIGLAALRAGTDPNDACSVIALLNTLQIAVQYQDGAQHTYLNGEDVTGLIRTQEVSMAASCVSRLGEVRRAMVRMQQQLAAGTDMLVDGRDICSVVLPNATVKLFLTASAEERARRRYLQLQEKGSSDTYEQVLDELRKRDEQDMNRAVDPLRQTEDAVLVDTTNMNFEQTVEYILSIVKEAQHE